MVNLPGSAKCVQGDLFPALVEDTDQSGLPAHPDLPPDILRGHRVISPLDLNVTVPVDTARRLFKDREQAGGQRQQFGPLHLVEHFDDLLPGRAVNARVGHRPFPIRQEQVLLRQTGERPPLECVVLAILDTGFDFSFVAGHGRPGGHYHRAIVPTKLLHLRVDVWIIPIRPRDRGPKLSMTVVLGNPAEVAETVLQATDEALRGLPPHHFAIALA